MNYITIEKLEDLNQLLMADIYLTGKKEEQEQELLYNTWEMNFSKKLIKYLTLYDLKTFISDLIKRRTEQVEEIGLSNGATFYMWFDKMSFQLCIDILSGKNIKLPFRCTVKIVKSCEVILNLFLEESKKAAKRECDIPFENLKFLEPGDEGYGKEDDFDPKSWIQDVYVVTIP